MKNTRAVQGHVLRRVEGEQSVFFHFSDISTFQLMIQTGELSVTVLLLQPLDYYTTRANCLAFGLVVGRCW